MEFDSTTNMDCIDLARIARVLGLGLKLAMASDFDGSIQLFPLTVQDSSVATWVTSVDEISTYTKLHVISCISLSLAEWHSKSRICMHRTNRRGPKTVHSQILLNYWIIKHHMIRVFVKGSGYLITWFWHQLLLTTVAICNSFRLWQ